MDRLTCTDADTRRAYAALLNAQIATHVCGQTGLPPSMAGEMLARVRAASASAIATLRRYPKSRTAHRPTTHASAF